MKTVFLTIAIISVVILSQSCELEREDYDRITPENFYNNAADAESAVWAIYSPTVYRIFSASHDGMIINDCTTPEMMGNPGAPGHEWFGGHEWSPDRQGWSSAGGHYAQYKYITMARVVAKNIEEMDIPDAAKLPLIAEARAMAGWLAFVCYDLYGPVPYPTDESLETPQDVVYPSTPSDAEFVAIIENLFSMKESLADPDFEVDRGAMNKGLANFILMKLYMLEAGRTLDQEYFRKAKELAEEIISEGWYEMEQNYLDVFSWKNKGNREVVYGLPKNLDFGGTVWHAEHLPRNYPCPLNDNWGSWSLYRMPWDFFDTFDKRDLRLDGILYEYVNYDGDTCNRENVCLATRHGMTYGAFSGIKYDKDPNRQGSRSSHDVINYRYPDVLLTLAECLNELGENASVNAPVVTQTARDETVLQSDGGNTPYSFIDVTRVRAGLPPLERGLSQSDLRDSIFLERGHEMFAEGQRRPDYIRYQQVTNDQGMVVFDLDRNKFRFPVPNAYIDEFKGNLTQNPGY